MRTLISLQLSGNFPPSTMSQRWFPAGQQSHLQFSLCLGMYFIWVRHSSEISLANILGTHHTTWWAWLLKSQRVSSGWFYTSQPKAELNTSHLTSPTSAALPLHSAPWGGSGLVPATIGLLYSLYFQGSELVHTVNQAFFRIHSTSFNSLVANVDFMSGHIWYGGEVGRVETFYHYSYIKD